MKANLFVAPSWCRSSIKVQKVLQEYSKEIKTSYKVIDVDTEEGAKLSVKYNVKNVPTLVFTNQGRIVGSKVFGFDKISKKIKELSR